MATKTRPERATIAQLIKIINTGKPNASGMSKMRALAAFRLSRSTKKVDVFSSILADSKEQSRFKQMAVRGLYELGNQKAEEALLANRKYVDANTALVVAQALSRIGSERVGSVIRELQETVAPDSKERASFAATLLAYRHQLEGYEVKIPRGNQLMDLEDSTESSKIQVSMANEEEIKLAMSAHKREPLGVSLSTRNAHKIVCGSNTFLWLWSKEFAKGAFTRGQKGNNVVWILFRKSRFEEEYVYSSVALGTPASKGLDVTLHRSGGAILYSGTIGYNDTDAPFSFKAMKRPGAAAIEFTGSIRHGRLNIEKALSAVQVRERRHPKRILVPA